MKQLVVVFVLAGALAVSLAADANASTAGTGTGYVFCDLGGAGCLIDNASAFCEWIPAGPDGFNGGVPGGFSAGPFVCTTVVPLTGSFSGATGVSCRFISIDFNTGITTVVYSSSLGVITATPNGLQAICPPAVSG
jgi:hypothetical protein